jgi:Mn2+/Fe2+ NRAMP family transporter
VQHPQEKAVTPSGSPDRATFIAMVAIAAAIVLIPGTPLIPILFLSQALNAVLLLVLLPFMRRLAGDPAANGNTPAGEVVGS